MQRSLWVLFLLLCGCAAIQPPPGGPEDKNPPAMDTTEPPQKALNVSRTPRIRFQFKQNVDRNSFAQAITITPYLPGVVKYNWYGYDEVQVELPDTLRKNTTYVITLTKDLKTLRGGPLKEPYQLLFSTGNEIDTGMITGHILPPIVLGGATDLKNVSVFAYDLSDKNGDTLHVDRVRPDYITQPSEKGEFNLKAMKIGHRYRFIAIIDEFRNRVYDNGIDGYGMPTSDATLSSQTLGGITMRLMPKNDTSRPQLQDYEVVDAYHIKAKFSKPIDSASVSGNNFIVLDSITATPIPIAAAYREAIDKKGGVVTLVLSKALTAHHSYLLRVDTTAIKDVANHTVAPEFASVAVLTTDLRDTFPLPKFGGFSFGDSTRGLPSDQQFLFGFSDAVDTFAFEKGLQLTDSTKKTVPLQFKWIDGTKVKVRAALLPKAYYKLSLPIPAVKSAATTSWGSIKDTTISASFFTGEQTEYGTVSGKIVIADSILQSGHLVVRLLSEEGVQAQIRQLPAGVTAYSFTAVDKGKYRVQAWLTTRADGGYEGGSPEPLRFALPSGDYPDLIDVRPRWTLENIDITLQ